MCFLYHNKKYRDFTFSYAQTQHDTGNGHVGLSKVLLGNYKWSYKTGWVVRYLWYSFECVSTLDVLRMSPSRMLNLVISSRQNVMPDSCPLFLLSSVDSHARLNTGLQLGTLI